MIRFRSADFEKDIKINDEDVQKYYDAHKAELKTDEKRKVEFVQLTLSEDEKKLSGRERIEALQKLARSYGELPPAKMQEFRGRATATLETNAPQPLLRLEASDVLQPNDSMTVWVDANTRRQRRIEINSSYDAKAVRIVSEFRDLPGGPTYMARSVVDYPHEELTLTVENFDHQHDAQSLRGEGRQQ